MASTDLVTIVYTDWVDSTCTRTKLGEDRADQLQRVHDRLVRDAIGEHGGTVVKGSGDGVLATFHSATDALASAVSVQQGIEGYSRTRGALAPMAVRIGMSVGDIVHQDGDIFGIPVVEAARLEAAAEPGQILCSELVRLMAQGRGGYEFDLAGMLELKGLPAPLAACIVRWERAGPDLAVLPLPPQLTTGTAARFVGRQLELDRAVGSAETERAQALWILGEPGIGKTRLATEVALRAHAAGAVALFGRCDEHVAAPFQPVIQSLRWHVSNLDDDQLKSAMGIDPEALARLVPELRSRLPGLGPWAPSSEGEQYRLFEAVRSWLGAASAESAVVLVVDDVHWADRPTLALLAHVLRSAEPARLSVIGTARDTSPDASDPLADLLDDLETTRRSRRVRLGGLTAEDVATMVDAAHLDGPTRELLPERLTAETAGNPLFVTAVLDGLSSQTGKSAMPTDVGAAVRRRVRRLLPPVQDLLQVAALVGMEFPLRVAADASDVAEAEGLARIEQAIGAGLIHELSVDRFRFTHGLVRDALAGELSASRTARVHLAIAQSLEHRFAGALDEHLRALGHHYACAGDDPATARLAYRYAVRSAERSLELLAFDGAVEDYGMALELLERQDSVEGAADRFDLLLAKGRGERLAGTHASALATLRRAAELARAREDWPGMAQAALAFEDASWRPGLLGHDALALLQEAAGYAGQLDPGCNAALRAALGRALHYSGHDEEARRTAEEAIVLARRVGDPAILALALTASVQTRVPMRATDLPVIAARVEEVSSLSDELGDHDPDATITEYGLVACLVSGDREGATRLLDRLHLLTDRVGSRFSRYVLLCACQIEAFLDADLVVAEQRADANLEFGRQLGEDVSGVHGVQLFLIRREQDRLAELAPVVRMLVRSNPTTSMWRPGLVLLMVEAGMVDEAATQLDDIARDDFASLPRDDLFPASLCFLAQAASHLGAADVGPRLAGLLSPWQGLGVATAHFVGHLGAADRYLGLLAALAGDPDEAAARFEAAVDFNRRLGAVVWEAHALVDLAALRGRVEDVERARALSDRHGLVAVARRLDAL